jgi:hypothetical protein
MENHLDNDWEQFTSFAEKVIKIKIIIEETKR